MKPVLFWTDLLIYLLFIAMLVGLIWTRQHEVWREQWARVGQSKLGMIACVLLLGFFLIGLLDSVHFKINPSKSNEQNTTLLNVRSLLDVLIAPLGLQDEETYSPPFALYLSARHSTITHGVLTSYYPRLSYGGRHLPNSADHLTDILKKTLIALGLGLVISITVCALLIFALVRYNKASYRFMLKRIISGKTRIAWREILITLSVMIVVGAWLYSLSHYYHVLGTDKIGGDVLYETLKSIRTGLIIGTLTTLVMLPFAVLFGTKAGYFGGWRDDLIQYIYTTLSSIPSVLLISAAVLSLQIYIANHPNLFATLENRADTRLLALCVILGITSWTSLCRLLRAETLKLREMDYIKASVAMGVRNTKIIWRHIVPNVLHIILITVVLDFSALVLAEAVLSYVGVGVDPITPSWGNMINSARLDLAREPVVWWPLFAAFIFMFSLVLAANLFADAVRDAFDPRLRNEA